LWRENGREVEWKNAESVNMMNAEALAVFER
jgi:hypothetical protein